MKHTSFNLTHVNLSTEFRLEESCISRCFFDSLNALFIDREVQTELSLPNGQHSQDSWFRYLLCKGFRGFTHSLQENGIFSFKQATTAFSYILVSLLCVTQFSPLLVKVFHPVASQMRFKNFKSSQTKQQKFQLGIGNNKHFLLYTCTFLLNSNKTNEIVLPAKNASPVLEKSPKVWATSLLAYICRWFVFLLQTCLSLEWFSNVKDSFLNT